MVGGAGRRSNSPSGGPRLCDVAWLERHRIGWRSQAEALGGLQRAPLLAACLGRGRDCIAQVAAGDPAARIPFHRPRRGGGAARRYRLVILLRRALDHRDCGCERAGLHGALAGRPSLAPDPRFERGRRAHCRLGADHGAALRNGYIPPDGGVSLQSARLAKTGPDLVSEHDYRTAHRGDPANAVAERTHWGAALGLMAAHPQAANLAPRSRDRSVRGDRLPLSVAVHYAAAHRHRGDPDHRLPHALVGGRYCAGDGKREIRHWQMAFVHGPARSRQPARDCRCQ